MRYLNEGGSPVYVVYEPKDFEDPVVGYTAIQYWMNDIGEDFLTIMDIISILVTSFVFSLSAKK